MRPTKENLAEFAWAALVRAVKTAAQTGSAWFINPLQDYLFLQQKYYLQNPDDERINVPGSVNEFNWTYRIPVSVEDLAKDAVLIEKIKEIARIHDGAASQGA